MKASFLKIFCAVFLTALFFANCKTYDNDSNVVRQSQDANNQNAKIQNIGDDQNQAKDDAEELGKIIAMPFETEEAIWKIEPLVENQNNNRVPGPSDTKLIAVLKFSAENAQKIAGQAANYKPATETSLNAESWFPPELVAKSQESGDETIKGIVYAPNDFAQPPYQNGTLTRIAETDYFVLELFTN